MVYATQAISIATEGILAISSSSTLPISATITEDYISGEVS